MPQVCNLLVFHARDSPGLERFVMDKCAESMHMALQVFWFLQAAVEDAARANNKDMEARVRLLRTRCETAAVNGSRPAMLAAAARRISAAALVAVEVPFSNRKRETEGISLFPSSSAGQLSVKDVSQHALSRQREVAPADPELENEAVSGGAEVGPGRQDPRSSVSDFDGNRGEADCVDTLEEGDAALDEAEKSDEAELSRLTKSLDATELNEPSTPESQPERKEEVLPLRLNPQVSQESLKDELAPVDVDIPPSPRSAIDPEKDFDPLTLLTMKQERFDYFNDSLSIAQEFVRLSLTTRDLPQEQRQAHLSQGLESINDILLRRMKGEPGIPLVAESPVPNADEVAALGRDAALRSVHLPLTRASSQALRILRVNSEEAVILTSRTRAPYMVNIEVLPTEMLCADKLLFCEQRVICPPKEAHIVPDEAPAEPALNDDESFKADPDASKREEAEVKRMEETLTLPKDSSGPTSVRRLIEMTPAERQRANVRKIVYGDAYSRQPEIFHLAEEASARSPASNINSPDFKARQAVILGIYGELWSWKEERILGKSPFRDLKDTRLMPFIVKAGDDLRQEQLAIQLISQLKNIFEEEGVDVFLRPFTVMSVSSEAGFVEVITDAVSVHSLKKRTPNFVSLLDYFELAYGANGTRSFRAAQRRFIRSMAGYSLVTYLLQIKDRHNGNIMIDVQGRVIHIDFGFMLTNSPGAIKFESVPFKLTEEYLQVICAKKNVQDLAEASKTEGYRYFQELFVLGLLAARKHYEKITTLVEIMTEGTTMPCMTGGHSIVESLRNRFAIGMPEEQCINFALALIEESRLSWRSAGYDRFQAYSNGYR